MAALPLPQATSSTRQPACGSTARTSVSATGWISAAMAWKSPLAHIACWRCLIWLRSGAEGAVSVIVMVSSPLGCSMDRRYGGAAGTGIGARYPSSAEAVPISPGVGTERRKPAWAAAITVAAMTLLAELVDASQRVAETSSRSQKVALLAELLARARPRRGRDRGRLPLGRAAAGPRRRRVRDRATASSARRRASRRSRVDDLDRAIAEIQAHDRQRVGGARRQLLADAARPRDRGRGRVRAAAAHGRAAAGRARRADGRRRREGGRRPGASSRGVR